MVMNAGQDVEQRPHRRGVEADAVGHQRRHTEGRRQADERRIVALFVAAEMPLQLDVEPVAAEDADQSIEQPSDTVSLAIERDATGQHDEPGGGAVQLLERQRALAFRRPELHACDQPAEVSVPVRVFTEDGQEEIRSLTSYLRDGELRPDNRLNPRGLGGLVKPRRAVDAVAIQQRERRILQFRGARDQRFGQRRALQETESRGGMEFDIHRTDEASARFQISGFRFQISGFRFQNSGFRFQVQSADCRLPTADCRLPTAECRVLRSEFSAPSLVFRPPTVVHRLIHDRVDEPAIGVAIAKDAVNRAVAE